MQLNRTNDKNTLFNVQSSMHGSIKYTKLDFHLLGRRSVVAVAPAIVDAANVSAFSTAIFVMVELSDELVLYRCAVCDMQNITFS